MGMIWRRHMMGSGDKGGHLAIGGFHRGDDIKGVLESGCGCWKRGIREKDWKRREEKECRIITTLVPHK
jgi:hypothetical protein